MLNDEELRDELRRQAQKRYRPIHGADLDGVNARVERLEATVKALREELAALWRAVDRP